MDDTETEFQELHEAFRPRILRHLGRLVSEGAAEDLTQDVAAVAGTGKTRKLVHRLVRPVDARRTCGFDLVPRVPPRGPGDDRAGSLSGLLAGG